MNPEDAHFQAVADYKVAYAFTRTVNQAK
jgi:hypothetical protein